LGRERARLETIVTTLDALDSGLSDAGEMLELAIEEQDEEIVESVGTDLTEMQAKVEKLEFQRMFSGEMDPSPCFIDIQAGSGGTEAQDWAEMFWSRTETGVHRLVRKSPFDSGNRRHTSFAGVFVSPEVDDNIEIDLNPADIRVDVYRASGAGGQHVNTTDSAVRMTHMPTGIVVQCQNDRSQHKNRDHAMKQLRARLYEHEMQKRNEEHQKLEDSKSDIGWGSQIRSYVLDQSRIKDLRTGVEVGNTQGVLDGDLDQFVEASLKQGL